MVKMKKNQKKTCVRCGITILNNEAYFHIEEFNEGIRIHFAYWHKKCWEDANQPRKLALGLARKANAMLDRMGGREIVELK